MSKADMTRDRIRRAAAELFSQRAYKEVTVRQIAAAANVDATLINHYFGGKEALFNTIIATAVEAKVQSFDFGSIPLENLGAEFIRICG
ncbi:helix-turn-helix domain-containing protein [uncultured Corynebacterium sp.]|uniref:TetR/AcrR family transcriptional regulator n=1 Tax=uncultured Corynebacterium sp. TaxID=159447 RepID=UPI00260FFD1E|nr:helix-turn-helix domain-containing protein [uncultured Corynebacterium sp.]